MREKEDIYFKFNISVRGFVEFLLRSGDIDNRFRGGADLTAMQEGSRIHRMIQGKMGLNYKAEVPLFYVRKNNEYELCIEGRADGIITEPGCITIDEIKSTYRSLDSMREPLQLHLAQAKCYAYMYGRTLHDARNATTNAENEFALEGDTDAAIIPTEGAWDGDMRIRLTYCNIDTEEIRYFYEDVTFAELESWFNGLMDEYHKWALIKCRQYRERQATIHELQFPFPYRPGQRELAVQVYQTINNKKKLFLEAPTGVGKTITTLFPAIKALGAGKADRIFYLTAKTITRTVANETFALLRDKGLRFRSITITAKEKICFCEKVDCNPDNCKFAKGHYDRINDAMYELLKDNDTLTREVLEACAYKHQVCPFELTLDASLFADAVVCDYNYLFDPTAKLQRFFGDGCDGNNIFLIDEAHNLLERGREMYSASLFKERIMELRREIKQTIVEEIGAKHKKEIKEQLSFNMLLDVIDGEDEANTAYFSGKQGKKNDGKSVFVKRGYAEKLMHHLEKCNRVMLEMKRACNGSCVVTAIDEFIKPLNRVYATISEYLEERERHVPAVMENLLEFFFDASHFLNTYELLDENYVMYSQVDDSGEFMLKLFCMNPAQNLKECMRFGVSTILFSATFLPIQYYKRLLGGEPTDYEVYAKSVFDPKRCGVFIANDVTSKYTRRSDEEYRKIAMYIDEIVHAKKGNYMIFFPSHAFMHNIFDIYIDMFARDSEKCIIQQEAMTEDDREEFLSLFEEESVVTAFCVLGGIFGEGIDLKEDRLIGSLIIGTGLPLVCFERELLKEHFDNENGDGFDYAYRFPGMNKVLQAAGRVIRTEEDRGIVALLDERFLQNNYGKLFPREWSGAKRVTIDSVYDGIIDFWVNDN